MFIQPAHTTHATIEERAIPRVVRHELVLLLHLKLRLFDVRRKVWNVWIVVLFRQRKMRLQHIHMRRTHVPAEATHHQVPWK